MNKITIVLACIIITLGLYGCGASPDDLIVSPSMYFNDRTLQSSQAIDITSKSDDSITIEKVIINKGNCKVTGRAGSKTINYGQTVQYLHQDCNVINVEVSTDNGDFEYSWDW